MRSDLLLEIVATKIRRQSRILFASALRTTRSHLGRHRSEKRLRSCSQRDHFAQHPQAILEKLNFAPLSVIPAHRNLTNSQSSMLREIKQFDIKGEAIEAGGFKHRAANVEAKRLKTALSIPKR
jgi:hypothetical protein